MSLPLDHILNLKCFENTQILAGKSKLSELQVSGITIIEAPDIADWIQGGELLLTSLYNFHSDYEKQRTMVKKLASKGASGLIVKTSRFAKEIPEVIIEEGKHSHLPIFKMPGDIKYIDIIYPVMKELFNHQLVSLEHYKKCHNKFIELSLHEGTIQDIADQLSAMVKHPVIIYDQELEILATTDCRFRSIVDQTSLISQLDVNSNLEIYRLMLTYKNEEGQFESSFVTTPVNILNYTSAYIAIPEIERPLDDLDFVAIETSVSSLSLTLIKKKAISEIEYRHKNDLMDDIIQGRFVSVQDISLRARGVGWHLDTPHVMMVLQLQFQNKHQINESTVIEMKKINSRILMILNNTSRHYSKDVILISKSDRILILMPTAHLNKESVDRFAHEVHDHINAQLSNLNAFIGIGTISESIDDIQHSFKEACDALTFGQMFFTHNAVIHYDELGVNRLLCNYENPNDLKQFIPPSLIKLNTYDKDKGGDFIHTLEEYLNNNANSKKTAESLFIHYKTVQYRINRIKEIMGIDFENSQFRLDVEMGLRILSLLDKKQI